MKFIYRHLILVRMIDKPGTTHGVHYSSLILVSYEP